MKLLKRLLFVILTLISIIILPIEFTIYCILWLFNGKDYFEKLFINIILSDFFNDIDT